MKKVLYIQPRIEVVRIKGEYIMAGFSGAKTVKDGVTIEDIPFNGKDSNTPGKADGSDLGAKRNFTIWEDDSDDNMNW